MTPMRAAFVNGFAESQSDLRQRLTRARASARERAGDGLGSPSRDAGGGASWSLLLPRTLDGRGDGGPGDRVTG
ncbi:hypothetical protein GCM10022255_024070 [Dactylosporangium darangshiense]|uniref:Uncharacterized protein n=1 Tax=Dactylosporangium darangshiense TaxID=579108 RepID=A0ABP8D547_9ACTN